MLADKSRISSLRLEPKQIRYIIEYGPDPRKKRNAERFLKEFERNFGSRSDIDEEAMTALLEEVWEIKPKKKKKKKERVGCVRRCHGRRKRNFVYR
ncbi:MAG: hypothetical protein ABH956_02575 [Candidatus Nealsonbacteria bacterium]